MKLGDLAKALGATLHGGTGLEEIARVMTLEEATAGSVSFLANPKYLPKLKETKASAVLVDARTLELHAADLPCPALVVPKPYVSFAQAVTILHPAPAFAPGVAAQAFIHPEAQLGAGVTVMPFAYVGRATIGAKTVIQPFCFVDDDVTVGPDCLLHPHVVLMRGTTLGARTILQPGCVVGSDGFGFAPDAAGQFLKIPQVGNVEIGQDVELGSNTTVDRAALGTTAIGDGTKIDNQVQVAHNVTIGKHVVISGQSAIAGSATLEDHVMVGGCSGVVGHITMRKGSKLSGGSHVMHDVPEGEMWMGTPAFNNSKRFRIEAHFRNLDDHVKTLKALQKRVATLEAQLAATIPPKS